MQQFPFKSSDLLEVRRRPLKDISNESRSDEGLRVKMLEAEKKIAESLAATAVTQREILRLQTIKTVGLLKDQLSKTETTLSIAKEQIANLEHQRTLDKEVLSDNEHMSERILELEGEITSTTQEHVTIVASMHFEREQFATRLFDLEKKLEESIALTSLNTETNLLLEVAETTVKNALQNEKDQVSAALQAKIEESKLSQSNLMSRIRLLKEKLGFQVRKQAETNKRISVLNEDFEAAKTLLEKQSVQAADSAAITAEQDRIQQEAVRELNATIAVYETDLLCSREAVQLYETQIHALQEELDDKTVEANNLKVLSTQRVSALNTLLEVEKSRVLVMERRLRDLDLAANEEMEECLDAQSVKDEMSSEGILSLKLTVLDLQEELNLATAQHTDSSVLIAKLRDELSSAESSAESEKSTWNAMERQFKESVTLSCAQNESLKQALGMKEETLLSLTTALAGHEAVCQKLTDELSLMTQQKEKMSQDLALEKNKNEYITNESNVARNRINEKTLALENADAAHTAEMKKMHFALKSCEDEILSLEIVKSNTQNDMELKCDQFRVQIDELMRKLSSTNIYQKVQGQQLYGVVEEIQAVKEVMTLKIQDLEVSVRDLSTALLLSDEKVSSGVLSARLSAEEIKELTLSLGNARACLEQKTEEAKNLAETNKEVMEKCSTLKKKVSEMKAELQNISEQAAVAQEKAIEESVLCRKREEVQAATADDLMNTMTRLKEEVWGAFKLKLAEKELEIQGLTAQVNDAQKSKKEAEEKSQEAVRSLTFAHEKYNILHERQTRAEEQQIAMKNNYDDVRSNHAKDMAKLQLDLGDRLKIATEENINLRIAQSESKCVLLSVQKDLELTTESLATQKNTVTSLDGQLKSLTHTYNEKIHSDRQLIDTLKNESHESRTRAAEFGVILKEREHWSEKATLFMESKVLDLTNSLQLSEERLSAKIEENSVIERTIQSLTDSLSESNERFFTLNSTHEGCEREIGCLVGSLEESVSKVTALWTESEARIISLTTALGEKEKEVTALSHLLKESDCKVGALIEAIGECNSRIALSSVESDDQIGSLTTALNESKDEIKALIVAFDCSAASVSEKFGDKIIELTKECQESSALAMKSAQECSEQTIHINELLTHQSTEESTHASSIGERDTLISLLQNEIEILKLKKIASTATSSTALHLAVTPVKSNVSSTQTSADRIKSAYKTDEKDREWSLMQGEVRRIRYARDEAKVSMSKMAGRAALQLQKEAQLAESVSLMAREFKDLEQRRGEETARLCIIQEDLLHVTNERDELLSQVTELESSVIMGRSPMSACPSRRGGKLEFSSTLNSPDIASSSKRQREKEMEGASEGVSEERQSILACVGSYDGIEDYYKDAEIGAQSPAGRGVISTPVGSYRGQSSAAIATDIDLELRSRLRAIRMEGVEGDDDVSKAAERKSQLLATRLDSLQKELDLKNQMVSNYDALKIEMDKKKEECKELKNRVLGLEKKTIFLQQELSVMRTLGKNSPMKNSPKGPDKKSKSFSKEKKMNSVGVNSSVNVIANGDGSDEATKEKVIGAVGCGDKGMESIGEGEVVCVSPISKSGVCAAEGGRDKENVRKAENVL